VGKCRFHNPEYLSLYHDGVLGDREEEEFSRHLLTCTECMEALMQLRRDLFLMETLPADFSEATVQQKTQTVPGQAELRPAGLFGIQALFRLAQGGLELLKNMSGEACFVSRRLEHAGEDESCFVLSREGFEVEVRSEGPELFCIEVAGLQGEKLALYREDRLLEARSNIRGGSAVFHGLARGIYSLAVSGREMIRFQVD
jgi:hypothetical protein